MAAYDHIVTIHTRGGPEISTETMSSDQAHELFAWLSSHFDGVTITIEQVVPVVVETNRRVLWRKNPEGGPNEHVANAIRDEEPDDFEVRKSCIEVRQHEHGNYPDAASGDTVGERG